MATENEHPGQGIPRIVFPIMGYTSSAPATMTSTSASNLPGNHPNQLIAQPVPSHSGPIITPGPYTNQSEPVITSCQHRGTPFGPFTAPVMSQAYSYTGIPALYANPGQPNVSPFQPDAASVKSLAHSHAPPPAHQIGTPLQSQTNATTQQVPNTSTPQVNTSLPVNSTNSCSSTNTVTSSHTGSNSQGRSSANAGSCTGAHPIPLDIKPSTSIPPVTTGLPLPFSTTPATSGTPSVSRAHSSKSKSKTSNSLSTLPVLEEFTVTKPANERQNFTNEVARQLFDEEYKKFNAVGEFKAYVSEQQRWRWDIHHNVATLETRVKNLLSNPNCGVAQNVNRYKTIPTNAKSEDVKRCEMTVNTMDAMVNRVATSRTELLHRKGNLLSKNMIVDPCNNEYKFLENCFSRVDIMYTTLITTRACINQTLAHLRQNFSQESAAAAEVRRLKRRRKENLRKKRKRREQTLEKRACEILLKITQSGVLERVWSNPEGQRVSANELLHNQLDALKSVNDVEALQLIISRGYLDPTAVEVVSRKMLLLQNGVK